MNKSHIIFEGQYGDSGFFNIEAHADLMNARPVYVLATSSKVSPFHVCTMNENFILFTCSHHTTRTDAMKAFSSRIEQWCAAA